MSFFLLLLFLYHWANGSRKRRQIIAKFQWTFNPVDRNMQVYLFPPKFFFLLHLFQMKSKTYIVSFLGNWLIWEFFCKLWSRYSSSIECVRHKERLPHNSIFIFQMENVSPGKTEKKRCQRSKLFNQFSSNFHQNDHALPGHLILWTDDLKNVGQSQNLQKCLFFKHECF